MRKFMAIAIVIMSAAALLPSSASAGWLKPTDIVVRGRVTNALGEGVAGIPVRVLATRRVVRFLTVESRPAEKEVIVGTTDDNGFYELTMEKLRDYDFYFLRFYDTAGFDGVRYAIPADVEITSSISKRRPVVEDLMLTDSPEWDAVERLVALYGEGSTRGRIVRDLGVPDRTERSGNDTGIERETWWFETAGVAYIIEDGRVLERKLFQAEPESQAVASQ